MFTPALRIFILMLAALLLRVRRAAAAPGARRGGSRQSIDDIREDYRVHAGPFHVEPAILLKELGVDTNVFNQAGETNADFTMTVAPQAAVAVPFGNRALVKSLLGTDLVYYAQYTSERSVDPRAAVRASLRQPPDVLRGGVLSEYPRAPQLLDRLARAAPPERSVGRVAFRATSSLTLEVAARDGGIRFDGDDYFLGQRLKETLDRDTQVYSVTARHRRNGLTTFGLRYENQTDRFPLSPIRDTDSFRVMPSVELRPRALLNGSAWVGYRRFEPKAAVLPPRPVWSRSSLFPTPCSAPPCSASPTTATTSSRTKR